MNTGKRTLTAVLCLLAVLLCAIGLTACSKDCAHEWNEWQIIKEATCTSTGTAERFCEICGTIESKTVEMIPHEWSEWQTTKEATCTSTGTAERICEQCETVERKTLEMIPHDFEDATCTEPKTCRDCGATEGEPLGHGWSAWVSNGDGTHTRTCAHDANHTETEACSGGTATCTDRAVCDHCGEAWGDVLGHNWGEWVSNGDGTHTKTCANDANHTETEACSGGTATCTDRAVCDHCGEAWGEPLGHNWSAWVSNGDDTHTRTCANDANHTETEACSGGTATCTDRAVCEHCGAAYGTTLPHAFDQQNTDAAYLKTPAGCETKAVYYYSCTCGETGAETFEWGEPLGHGWSAWVSNGDGTHTRTCANDANHTETEACSGGTATCTDPAVCDICGGAWGDVLGHNWGEWVSNGDGTHTRTCANDANHTETEACSGGTATCTDRAVCDHCGEAYGEAPAHAWGEGVVTTEATCTTDGVRTYTCSVCHETRTEKIPAAGHDYAETVTLPTCTEKGYTTYTCRTCDHTYTGNEVGATGHTWDGEVTCETGRECTVCHITEPATSHRYVSVGTTEADCEHPGTETFRCENCGDEYTRQTASAKGHSIAGVTPTERKLEGCNYIQIYVCTACGGEVEGDHVSHHTYVASVTREATCVADGEKTLVCSACGDTKTETIARNENGHNWDEGTLAGNIRTYHCQNDGCTATKTSVDASGSTSADVSADDLANAGGVQLENAEIAMDEDTLAQMSGKDLTISSDTLTGEDLDAALGKLDDAQKAQLGSNPTIYNFLIMEGGTVLSQFDGEVTVTLPYTLSEGEDVDSIAVWYMSEGAPVSIKATYSNGYITFKTNHFSYYTVTLLTPQERCTLYGHNFATSHVEGTCLTDGYDLQVCKRCHETVKTVTRPATGHNYVGETTDPTCVSAGKTVYTCEHCHDSYEVKLPATGHTWAESEHVDATCTAPGYVLYVCANCGDSYRVTSAQLMHTYTDTVVSPTCDSQGYTHHVCDSCGHAYDDTPVPSLGHIYNLTFEWSDDDLTATAVFVCENDHAHTLSVPATVTVKVTEPTCAEAGSTVYTAKATLNGVIYTDTQTVEGERLDHSYADEWTYNKDEHWHACAVCGDRTDVAAHAFDEGTVTKQPTCSEAGETVFACACGFVKTEVIPATGEHVYVDGVCTQCGKADGACDHTHLHDDVIDMADYGACGGLLHVQVCDCGERVMLDIQNSEPMCDLSGADMQNGIDEDGRMWMSVNGVCPDCGMLIRMHATATRDGCATYYFYDEVTFISADGTAILDHAQVEMSFENHRNETATIDLGELGFCGGTVTVERCPDCGKVQDISGMNPACDMSSMTEDQFTDENGIEHMVIEFVCADCGLHIKGEMWMETPSVCVTVTHVFYGFYGPDSTIFECNQENTQSHHEYEITDVVLRGETCEDGYTATETCRICGDTYRYQSSGHRTEEVVVDIAELGGCGGQMVYRACAICHTITDMLESNIGCSMKQTGSTTITDEQGHQHFIQTSVCETCGLIYVTDMWMENPSPCVTVMHGTMSIRSGEELLWSGDMIRTQENHNYERIYELLGETCNDGYRVTETCTVCGESHTGMGGGHFHEETVIDLSEHSDCGSLIRVNHCAICGETFDFKIERMCDGKTTKETYIDNEGIEHRVQTLTCDRCGLVWWTETWTVSGDGCEVTRHYSMRVSKDGEIIFEGASTSTWSDHNYEYTYHLHGETCEDGYTVTETCTVCGESYTWEGSGHRSDKQQISLEEYGACGGWVYREYCPICDETLYFNVDSHCPATVQRETVDRDGVTHTIETLFCEECGLVIVYDSYTVSETSCRYKRYITCTVAMGDTVLFSEEYVRTVTQHSYEYEFFLKGETCDDGYTVNMTCTVCGETHTEGGQGHNTYLINEYDLAEYGACGGYVRLYRCPCGAEQRIDWNLDCDYGWQSDEYTDENGITHDVSNLICNDCQLIFVIDEYYEKEGCRLYAYATYRLTVGNNVVFEDLQERDYRGEQHNYTYSFELHGESCDDGYTVRLTCAACGETRTEEGQGHCTYMIHRYDLAEYGACGGYVQLRQCPCGTLQYIDWYLDCNYEWRSDECTDENGITHEVVYYLCSDCQLVLVIDQYFEKEGCTLYAYATYRLAVGNDVVFEGLQVREHRGEQHDYQYSYELHGESCEDGYTVTATCAACGETNTWEDNGHQTYPIETYDLTEYGACYGYFEHWKCLCGAEEYVSYDFCGSWSSSSYEDEEGRLHHVTVYRCETCGLWYQEDRFEVHDNDNCTTTVHTTYTLSVGDTLVANVTILKTREAHRYEVTASLPDGHTSCDEGVVLTYTCPDCGKSYEQTTNKHYMLTVATIDLAQYGAVCGGYLTERACACGARHEMNTSGMLCERVWIGSDLWIEDALTNSLGNDSLYWDASGWQCAVTDPEPCIAVRYARYFRKVASGCYAEQYETWQIGYDAQNGTCLYEVTFKTGEVIVFHNYEATDINTTEDGYTVTGTQYTCPDCGSYRNHKNYCDEEGRLCKEEHVTANLLDNGREKYTESVFEYVFTTDNNGNTVQYTGREYRKSIDAYDNESWSEILREKDYSFTAGFSDYGYRESETMTDSNGFANAYESAQVRYMGYWYTIYEYNRDQNEEGDHWHRAEYTYDFAAGCVRYIHETDSNGMDMTAQDTCHHTHWVTMQGSTCTQDGWEERVCYICSQTIGQSVLNAHDHYWMYDAEKGTYICTACGLENVNGVSGDIVLEDLTEKAGNGTDYVVGYFNCSEVEFIYYVSLILHTPAEDGNDEVILEGIAITEPSGIRAFAFAKADVTAAAEELGYAAGEYDVRFAFVPEGADGRVDYAITFTE